MPDWKQEIERRLAPMRLSPTRKVSVAEELAQHLDDHCRELIGGGASAEEARSAALAGLDRDELLRELQQVERESAWEPATPTASNMSLFSGLGGDLRYTSRILRKAPGFSTIAVLTIAIGIAANTAIFSIINSLFLHPPGVTDSDRLMAVRVKYQKLNLKNISISLTDFADVRDSKQVFSSTAAMQPANFNYAAGPLPERIPASLVTWNWFDTFGARPILGRTFTQSEDVPGANHEVVLSYTAWQRLFGKDQAIVGKSMLLNGQSYRVVGVMDRDFNWPSQSEIWVPVGLAAKEYGPDNRFNESYDAVARLAPGVSRQQAEAYAGVLSQRVATNSDDYGRYARSSQWSIFLMPFSELIYGGLRMPLLVLAGSVGCVLLICCANVAGLMLAKSSGRAKELTIRIALGARRRHLVRQIFVESVLIAACGTAVGIGLAVLAVRNATLIAPEGSISSLVAPIDRSVLLFSIAAGMASALLFGLAPALMIAAAKTFEMLKEGGRSAMSSKGRQRVRSALVVGEVGLALVLLVGAGLFLKSLIRTQQLSPGFDSRGVMTGAVSLDAKAYDSPERRQAFFTAVTQNLAAQPGIDAAAAAVGMPFSDMGSASSFAIEGRLLAPGDPGPHSDIAVTTSGYFRALSVPLRAGRYFTGQDRLGAEPVAIIDEILAKQYWPGQDPLGARIKRGKDWTRIVGIVAHVNRSSLAADTGKGLAYYPLEQISNPEANLVVRTSADPVAMAATIRAAVKSADPSNTAVYDLKPMSERVAASLGPRRFAVTMLLAFATMALLLAAIGLYGVISYSVVQRTQEIGVRMALGARLAQVMWLVLSQSLRMVLAGVAIGLAASLVLARLLQSELIQVSAFDPLTFAGMCAVLVAVTLAATYLPARRAAKVDPMLALRHE
ncbi:MAG TPA: ABC transporter permease [Candidatus Dormibacteraeota bacterium]|nr:ABC transporter permease [Candidatus Dormibacteraeota bacterium]